VETDEPYAPAYIRALGVKGVVVQTEYLSHFIKEFGVSVASLIAAGAWPAIAILILLIHRRSIAKFLENLESVHLPGGIEAKRKSQEVVDQEATTESSESAWEFTPSEAIQGIRERIVAALAHHLECSFVKKSRALYWAPSRRQRMVCTESKRYANQSLVKYWYAYHLQWHAFPQEGESGFFVLGCTDLDVALWLSHCR
jgi:hypothetical protein